MVKPLLETKTYNKVKFGYSDDQNTKKLMEDLFDFDHLESAFGGKDTAEFEINKYAERMKEDDKKIPSFWASENSTSSVQNIAPSLDSIKLDTDSDASDNEKKVCASDSEKIDCSPNPDSETDIIDHDENNLGKRNDIIDHDENNQGKRNANEDSKVL